MIERLCKNWWVGPAIVALIALLIIINRGNKPDVDATPYPTRIKKQPNVFMQPLYASWQPCEIDYFEAEPCGRNQVCIIGGSEGTIDLFSGYRYDCYEQDPMYFIPHSEISDTPNYTNQLATAVFTPIRNADYNERKGGKK